MPVAPNPLLQTATAAKPSKAGLALADKPQQAGEGGFDKVMAGQTRDKVAPRDDKPAPARNSDGMSSAESGKPAAAESSGIAADGKPLPAQATDQGSDEDSGTLRDASLVAGQVTDAAPGAQLIQAQAQAVAPMLQAAQSASSAEPAAERFDPESDPLAGMPTLRLALEQNARAQGTTSTHASDPDAEVARTPTGVNPLASELEGAEGEGKGSERGGKSFGALMDDGLKDLKASSSDTRVDDFASRLANLTQAVTPKTAQVGPLHQPLPMNPQSAWTEGLVNRVMYLSSQNLKSADIQLEPAELGRLDIRVHVTNDQSTQITFISGHPGVRDALDSQVHRLRELFTQQGLQQPDVNVADQSRQQQQQPQQQDTPQLSGVAARRAEAGEVTRSSEPGIVQEQQVVIGDSAVDFYA